MEDLQKSSWWDFIAKTLKNLMDKQEDKLMKAAFMNTNHSSRKFKDFLHRRFGKIAVTTATIFLLSAAQFATELMRKAAQGRVPDQTTVQLGTADPVPIDKEASTMLADKKLIDVESFVDSRSGQSPKGNRDEVIIKVPAGQTSLFLLSDGSKVLLNSMSELRYSRSAFVNNRRQVRLQGQAYFEVKADEKRPFLVLTPRMNVTVIGTSFTVRCFQTETRSVVALRTGKVLVGAAKRQETFILAPGESAVLDKTNNKFGPEKNDAAVAFGWIQDNYILHDKSLQEICDEFSRLSGEKIIIDPSQPADRHFYFPFNRKKGLRAWLEALQTNNDSLNYYQTKGIWHIQ